MKNILIIGAGYVGFNTAWQIFQKDQNIKFLFYDVNAYKINNLLRSKNSNIEFFLELKDKIKIKKKQNKLFNQFRENCYFYTNILNILKFKKINFTFITINTSGDKLRELNILKSLNYIPQLNCSNFIIRSTVHPGFTEKFIMLYNKSNFKVCHFPERYSPGKNIETFSNIISGDKKLIKKLSKYFKFEKIVKEFKYTELAKIWENTQRYILLSSNLLFKEYLKNNPKINELDFDIIQNLCKTKNNYILTEPNFIGGECIGVDHKYLKDYTLSKLLNSIDDEILKTYSNWRQEIKEFIEKDKSKKYLIIGGEYKPDTNSFTNSPLSILIHPLINENLLNIQYKDNIITYQFYQKYGIDSIINEIKKYDRVIILTNHSFLKNKKIKKELRKIKNKNIFILNKELSNDS